jgi:hypothetical protein
MAIRADNLFRGYATREAILNTSAEAKKILQDAIARISPEIDEADEGCLGRGGF